MLDSTQYRSTPTVVARAQDGGKPFVGAADPARASVPSPLVMDGYAQHRRRKVYELKNHLGNVLAVVSDVKVGLSSSSVVDFYTADVVEMTDYEPFGMQLAGRRWVSGSGYRFGFNGKESDDEWSGEGNMYNYGFRIHDPRLGRFLSVDPLAPDYPWYTPYQFAGNIPIWAIDLDGLEPKGYEYRFRIVGKAELKVGVFAELEAELMGVGFKLGINGATFSASKSFVISGNWHVSFPNEMSESHTGGSVELGPAGYSRSLEQDFLSGDPNDHDKETISFLGGTWEFVDGKEVPENWKGSWGYELGAGIIVGAKLGIKFEVFLAKPGSSDGMTIDELVNSLPKLNDIIPNNEASSKYMDLFGDTDDVDCKEVIIQKLDNFRESTTKTVLENYENAKED